MYHGPPEGALKLFQFGAPAALTSGMPLLQALLEINEARAYARMGAAQQAKSALSLAVDLFGDGADDDCPEWLRFFDSAELWGAAGLVWVGLGDEQRAITALRRSLAHRPEQAVLYRAFDTAELAASHLRNGDIGEGLRVGALAVRDAESLSSRRARSRLTPLALASRASGAVARSFHERIVALQRG